MFSRRLDWLADMLMMLIYAPFLIFLPVLLVLAIVFVVGPSGLIILLGGAYTVVAAFIGLLGIAVRTLLRKIKTQIRVEPNARLSTARTSQQTQRA
jgi:hypothetical protein